MLGALEAGSLFTRGSQEEEEERNTVRGQGNMGPRGIHSISDLFPLIDLDPLLTFLK